MNAPGGLSINFEKKYSLCAPNYRRAGGAFVPMKRDKGGEEEGKETRKVREIKPVTLMKYICSLALLLACWFCRRFIQKPRGSIQFMINHKIDEKIMLMTMVKRVKQHTLAWRESECRINLHFLGPFARDDKALIAHIIIACRQRSDGKKKKSQVAGNAT